MRVFKIKIRKTKSKLYFFNLLLKGPDVLVVCLKNKEYKSLGTVPLKANILLVQKVIVLKKIVGAVTTVGFKRGNDKER